MLNRNQLEEFMELMFEEKRLDIPEDLEIDDVVEAFFQYCNDDLNEWLQAKFSDFFLLSSGETSIDWNWVRQNINAL